VQLSAAHTKEHLDKAIVHLLKLPTWMLYNYNLMLYNCHFFFFLRGFLTFHFVIKELRVTLFVIN
jgi:hypothetical protein